MSDASATRFPVSVKGVLFILDKVLLLKNERNEWELPGGKLEIDEGIESCLVREIEEETGLKATVETCLHNWIYYVNSVNVVIITYLVRSASKSAPVVSSEHKQIGMFGIAEISGLNMPEGYKTAIIQASNLSRG